MKKNIKNNLKYSICPLCKSSEIFEVGAVDYGSQILFSSFEINISTTPELWTCKKCESCFTQNAIQKKLAHDLYLSSASNERWLNSLDSFYSSKSQKIIQSLNDEFNEGKKVLDFGCNDGLLLDFARDKGCITSGVELSKTSVEILREKDHKVFNCLGDIGDESIDIITAFDVIEHIYDLPSLLKEFSNKLKVGGRLIVLTGDSNSISSKLAKNNWWYSLIQIKPIQSY